MLIRCYQILSGGQPAFLSMLLFMVVCTLPVCARADHQDETAGHRFSHQTVINMAEKLSFTPYQAPQAAPASLLNLDYSTYRQINFQQQAAIWGNSPTKFSVQLFAPGYLYKDLVDIDIIEDGISYPLSVEENSFHTPTPDIGKILAQISKYAGFRLHFPINSPDYADEFVVFQGASYFRAVSKGQLYGLSTRGLAIDVAERKGEEFPIFKHFWIERPDKSQSAIVVHALLDSESVTGAYRFGIYPDAPTRMDVQVKLFPRRDLNHVGIAPLTSMFMHSPLVPSKKPDYRPAVHDSEALAMTRGNGEQLWRPLNNPDSLQISAFMDENPKGFGLIQRHRNFSYYQDLEANYHRRPSVWVKPMNNWGAGQIQLVEIPSDSETNDNIIAYWRPAETLKQGMQYTYSYQLSWPDDISPMPEHTEIVRSASGQKLFQHSMEVAIDYSHLTPEQIQHATINASISEGQIIETRLQENPEIHGGRLFVVFDPKGAKSAEIRVQLKQNEKAISETWLFRWIKKSWSL